MWEMRQAHWDKASQASNNIVATIEADIARTIDSYDLSLQGVIDGLKLPETNQVSKETRQVILFDRAATAKHLGAIRVIDAEGRTIIDSRNLDPQQPNRSERDYFKVHAQSANAGLYIGRPFEGDDGQYIIGISRRLSHPDGSFAGVVVGSLQLGYFHDLFRKVKLGQDGAMGLTRTDGIMLMRSPFDIDAIGRDISHSRVFEQAVGSHLRQFEETASTDGVKRLHVIKQVGDHPLLIMVAVSIEEIYAGWRQQTRRIGLLVLALCGATLALALFSAQELRRRAEAERALAILATTDSLTGLANRRRFDEVFEDQWQRSIRRKTSLTVLMIDVDHFKAYNDSHGHLAGDDTLKMIAACVSDCTRKSSDFAARFGGEEFVVVLPDTSLDLGVAMAERIRNLLVGFSSKQPNSPQMPTVSIGVGSQVPQSGTRSSDLIDAADIALYEAKRNGRNRTEPARRPSPKSSELKLVVNQ